MTCLLVFHVDQEAFRRSEARCPNSREDAMTGDSIRSGARWALLLTGTALLLAACAAGPNELVDTGQDPAGFWLGLWQGLISPITFIVS